MALQYLTSRSRFSPVNHRDRIAPTTPRKMVAAASPIFAGGSGRSSAGTNRGERAMSLAERRGIGVSSHAGGATIIVPKRRVCGGQGGPAGEQSGGGRA